jgi:hypothetical protein
MSQVFTVTNLRNIIMKFKTHITQVDSHTAATVSGSATSWSTASSPQNITAAGVTIATKNVL